MRIAIVACIHGNRTAFEAVLADLRRMAPDLILHGGDLADCGSSPATIIDHIRDLRWPGVAGNTDEMLWRPAALEEFVAQSPAAAKPIFDKVREMAAAARETLGEDRIHWLSTLPLTQTAGSMTLVHASPNDLWRAPAADADDAALRAVYNGLASAVAVYSHIHRPFVRHLGGLTVANTGSAGLPYDADPRASYLLLDDAIPTIRRVAYDIGKECAELSAAARPGSAWTAAMLRTGVFLPPPP